MVSSLNQIFEQYGENKDNLAVIGISLLTRDNQEKMEKFNRDNNGNYPEIEGAKYGAEIFSKYRNVLGDGIPNLCLIDPGTREIVWHGKGYKTYRELETILTKKGVEKRGATLSIHIHDSKDIKSQFSMFYVQNNTLYFNTSGPASYNIIFLSPRGSKLKSQIYNSRSQGLQAVNLSPGIMSSGSYIIKIINKNLKASKLITVLK